MNRIGLLLILVIGLILNDAFAFEALPKKDKSQKAFLVTGATSGIGKNITETLAANGHYVYAGARKQKDIEMLNKIANVQAVKLDVTDQSDIDSAVKFIEKEGRGLDGLINNAGVGVFAPLIEMSEADIQFQMDVNLFGPYRVSKAFAPLIIKSKGRINTIGSISGASVGRFFGAYSMSKFAVEAFTDAMDLEMQKFGVKVSVVEPGNYNSKIAQSALKRMKKNADKNVKSLYEEEFKGLSQYLTSDRSRYKEPDDVAKAVMDAMLSPNPKKRYMVVPAQGEAEWAIRGLIRRMAQMNHGQEFSYDRDALINILDEELIRLQPSVKQAVEKVQ